jgi:hypothetical protein
MSKSYLLYISCGLNKKHNITPPTHKGNMDSIMKAYGGVEVQFHSVLISALDGG